MNRMLRSGAFACALITAGLAPLLLPLAAHAGGIVDAATGVAPPVIVATAPGVASLPYGDWITAALQVVQPLAILLLTFAARSLISQFAPILAPFITDRMVDGAVQKWVDYGVNATAGAVKGKTLDVDTGSQVLATALNRAGDRANVSKLGEKLMTWAGGPEEVAAKIFRALPLDEHASTTMVAEAVQDFRLRGAVAAPAAPPTQAKF